jgi:hypothetical protein
MQKGKSADTNYSYLISFKKRCDSNGEILLGNCLFIREVATKNLF